ncbi:hypothetical protein CPB84DRAFT_1773809 [Gymnopilus junonius]|uniref:Uncharacterized protein n=1 Tax=Gymnopilus junonius TaxID=109634 RepID=A0A9P5NP80_GYMJU|nr:hypothetical protein CPB84DRAFT_1773809 [Gymnopilus junonius]
MKVLNYEGKVLRQSMIEWNDRAAEKWRKMNKETNAKLASGFVESIRFSLDSMTPKEVEAVFDGK